MSALFVAQLQNRCAILLPNFPAINTHSIRIILEMNPTHFQVLALF